MAPSFGRESDNKREKGSSTETLQEERLNGRLGKNRRRFSQSSHQPGDKCADYNKNERLESARA